MDKKLKTVYVDKIPSVVSKYFASVGVTEENTLLAMRSDLRADGSRGDCFIMLTESEAVIAEGIIEFTSAGRSANGGRIRSEEFKISRYERFAVKDIGEPRAEQLISTGRVVAEAEGGDRLIFNFSSASTVPRCSAAR